MDRGITGSSHYLNYSRDTDMFHFNAGNFGQGYQDWLKQLQGIPGTNPFVAHPWNQFSAFPGYGQNMQMLQQVMDWLMQFPAGVMQGNSPFSLQSFGNTFAQVQQLAGRAYKLAGSTNQDAARQELLELTRQVAELIVDGIRDFSGGFLTTQTINNARTGLAWQQKVMKEQMVQVAITPWRGRFETYQKTCILWQEACDSALGLMDVFQQFTEVFADRLVAAVIDRIDTNGFTPGSPEDLAELYVQLSEKVFVELLNSESFGRTYGEFVNAVIAARENQQQYIDDLVELQGLPSKREMDSAHKKTHRHNKELRNIRHQLMGFEDALKNVVELVDVLQSNITRQHRGQFDLFANQQDQMHRIVEYMNTLVANFSTLNENMGKQIAGCLDVTGDIAKGQQQLTDIVTDALQSTAVELRKIAIVLDHLMHRLPKDTPAEAAGKTVASAGPTGKSAAKPATVTRSASKKKATTGKPVKAASSHQSPASSPQKPDSG